MAGQIAVVIVSIWSAVVGQVASSTLRGRTCGLSNTGERRRQ
jgi:hypothetical protein